MADRKPVRSGNASDDPDGFTDASVRRSVGSRFREIAMRHADSEALSSPAGSWTYARMLTDVDRVAGGLQALIGTGGSRPVAVLAAHDGPLVVATMGVIRSGNVVVVLDPASPEEHLCSVLQACTPAALLYDGHHADLAGELARPGSRTCAIEHLDAELKPPDWIDDHSPAMLAFTSGTTDQPKGAVITQGVLMNLVRGATEALGIGPDDRMPMLFPVSLAVAAYPMFLPLLNGGTLATLDVRAVGLEPIGEFLERERITLAYMAPTVVRFLEGALGDRCFPDLRMLALGGELVDAEVVELTTRLFAPDLLAVGYGTTETGVVALQVLDPSLPGTGSVPCGHAVPEVEIAVLDDVGDAAAPGESGEIAVLSPHLFSGYWNHPELSRQVLGPDPEGRPGWGLFRTGDHGSIDVDGRLTVHGRVDTKVKVRGRFVVIGEVEADLRTLESIADAAVLAESRGGHTELVAYVVAGTGGTDGPIEWRSTLLDRRESFMVPSRWVVLDELPRLPNGKLDRRALPSTDPGGADVPANSTTTTVPAMLGTPQELRDRLRTIWERLLPIGRIGDDEDFFHLGGDSLLAAQMLVHVEHEMDVIVPMGELVHARTIRSMGEAIRRSSVGVGAPEVLVSCVQQGDEERPRLWFVPDLQGSAYRVRHLATALGADQPLWSFESPLLSGKANPFSRLDTFAARLLTDLRRAQPAGPYWLAGYSFGGVCAYEMARQLRRDGEEVAFLGVVDVGPSYRGPGWSASRSPGRPWFGVAKPAPPGASLSDRVRHYRRMVSASPLGAARHLMVRTGVARVVDPVRFRLDLVRHGRVRPEWRLWYAWEEHWKLAARHWNRAATYAGRMDLFWESTTGSTDSTMGWGRLVDDLHIHRFAIGEGGDHDAILEPAGADALGPVLRWVLDDLRGPG